MDLTLEEFSKLASKHLLMVPETQVEAFYDGINDYLKKRNGKTNEFIAAYCEVFKARYGSNPLIGKGKEAGVAKRVTSSYGKAVACELIRAYLRMNDARFVQARHDLVTFELCIQRVHGQLIDGSVPTLQEAQRVERRQSNANAFQSVMAKKGLVK